MDWMRRLAKHYERARERYPGKRLIVLFDIDGTILDMRYAVRYALRGYDAAHGTRYFSDLTVNDAPDLESFLEAVMLLPTSVTADFNFPKWRYFGQGSGENDGGYEYLLRPAAPAGV